MARVQSIAHRGASGHCPENTLAAFGRAIELGADMVEVDAQLSSDGVVFLCHDDTLSRTTNGRGHLSQHSSNALRALDAGSWFGDAFRGERLPTLEDAIGVLRGKVSLNLELKTGNNAAGPLERESIEILERHGLLDETVFSSFSARRTRAVREISARARIGVLVHRRIQLARAFELAREVGAEALHPWKTLVTPDLMRKAAKEGLAVRGWLVDASSQIERLCALGIEGIFTDFPERVACLGQLD